jgi:cation:H+ antiporter
MEVASSPPEEPSSSCHWLACGPELTLGLNASRQCRDRNAALLAGNLFGGVALQTAILAVVDVIAVRGALAYFTPQPVLLLQGVMLLLLLAVALAGAAAGEPVSFFGVGLTPVLLLAGYILTLRLSQPGDYLPRWRAINEPEEQHGPKRYESAEGGLDGESNRRLYIWMKVCCPMPARQSRSVRLSRL